MAEGDSKSDDSKEKKKLTFWMTFDSIEWGIIAVIFFAVVFRVDRFFTGGAVSAFSTWLASQPTITADIDAVRLWLSETARSLTAFSNGFSLLLAVVIGYIIFRQNEINKAWHKKLYPEKLKEPASFVSTTGIATGLATDLPADLPIGGAPFRGSAMPQAPNPRWQKVLEHIASDNPSDWRLAVLEADIVLEETLDRAGYIGDTLGDKLKNAEHRPFASLNAAWEAHKVRNTIAHQGQSFDLTQRDARQAIALFEAVFRELGAL